MNTLLRIMRGTQSKVTKHNLVWGWRFIRGAWDVFLSQKRKKERKEAEHVKEAT